MNGISGNVQRERFSTRERFSERDVEETEMWKRQRCGRERDSQEVFESTLVAYFG